MVTKVTMQSPKLELANSDHVITVHVDGAKRGEFHLSRGSVDFYPRSSQQQHRRLTWAKLADLFEEKGKERT